MNPGIVQAEADEWGVPGTVGVAVPLAVPGDPSSHPILIQTDVSCALGIAELGLGNPDKILRPVSGKIVRKCIFPIFRRFQVRAFVGEAFLCVGVFFQAAGIYRFIAGVGMTVPRIRQEAVLGVLVLPNFYTAADRQEGVAAFLMGVFQTAYQLPGKAVRTVDMGDDFRFAADKRLGGFSITVLGVNMGLGLRLRADQHPHRAHAAFPVNMGFLRRKTAHENLFFGIAGIIVGVGFVFGESAGQYFLSGITGVVMGVDGNRLAFFIAADIARFLGVTGIGMDMGGLAFALGITADQDRFCVIAAFTVRVGENLRQSADQVPGTVITEGFVVMDNEIGIAADKISVPVTAEVAVTVDFQGAA